MHRRKAVALAAVAAGLLLLSVPAFVHSHAAHSGHVSFSVRTEGPPSENASWDSSTTVNASEISEPILEEMREAASADGVGSVLTHAWTLEDPLASALDSSPMAVYVRDGETWYRLSRTWGATGFVDGALILEGISFAAGLVTIALGGWYGVFGGE